MISFWSLLTGFVVPLLTSFEVSSERFCGIAMGFRFRVGFCSYEKAELEGGQQPHRDVKNCDA